MLQRLLTDHCQAQEPIPALDRRRGVFHFTRVEPGQVWLEVGRARGGWRILTVVDMLAPKKPRAKAQPKGASWHFASTLRARAFGWKSSALAAKRLKEAVAEVKQAAKADPQRAADGAVLVISKIEPAFEQVDSSSGSLGSAVHRAVDELTPIIAAGCADPKAHRKRLEKLYQALLDAGMGYLDGLGDHWGEMCGTADLAAEWADWLVSTLEEVWRFPNRGHFPGTGACLSSLLAAGRPERVLELIALEGYVDLWFYRRYGVEALKQLGRMEDALALARRKTRYDTESQIDLAIEELLIEMGRAEEAYREVGLHLRRAGTYNASFAALCKRYPGKPKSDVLRDLLEASPPTRASGSRPRSGWASWTSPPKSPAPPATPAR